MHKKLFIPGPTEVSEEVLNAMTKPMIGHRMKEFSEMYVGIIDDLKKVLNTEQDTVIFTSSGTAVMEAAIRNCVEEKVLCCVNGAFSERWFNIAKSCGKKADKLEVEWGEAIKAVVSVKPGMKITEEEIINFCKENIASYKKPKSVDFLDSLPKNAYGKILKREIREKYLAD